MATQPLTITGTFQPDAVACSGWRAYHIFHSADQGRLCRLLVGPLIASLARSGAIDRFFFVRYELGGLHLRLRWRVTSPKAAVAAESALADRVIELQRGLRFDHVVRSSDGWPWGDMTWTPVPVEFEVERYGGPARFPASLDLFHCASAEIVQLFRKRADSGSTWIPAAMLRLMLRLAWGMAGEDEHMFLDLIGYGERFMGARFPKSAGQSDAVFDRQGPRLVRLAAVELECMAAFDGPDFDHDGLAAGGSRLAVLLDGLSEDARWYLAASHIHMAANRLGLTNAEEVYVSRLLWRAVDTLRCESPDRWRHIRTAASGFMERAHRRSLAESASAALAALAPCI